MIIKVDDGQWHSAMVVVVICSILGNDTVVTPAEGRCGIAH